jgi:hypothetical protein
MSRLRISDKARTTSLKTEQTAQSQFDKKKEKQRRKPRKKKRHRELGKCKNKEAAAGTHVCGNVDYVVLQRASTKQNKGRKQSRKKAR